MRDLGGEAQFLNMAWAETIAVTVFLPRPETSASWRIEAAERCATRIMSSRVGVPFGGSLRAETDNHESRANLTAL
jgi:hypothetical protein